MQTASNILDQMLDQSKKNIYPHQQHTVKKNTVSTPTKNEIAPKTQNPTVNTIDPGKFHRTALNQNKSIRPKPTSEAQGKKKVG